MEKSRYAPRAASPAAATAPPPAAASVPAVEPVANAEENNVPVYPVDPSMEEFAQTRPPDDLFDDDFTPITESESILDPPQLVQPEPEQTQFLREPPKGPRGRGGRRGGGRTSPPRAPPAPAAKAAESGAEEEEAADATSKPERKEGAVKGDRSGTGGVKKAKLTETELAERIAAMSLKNAALLEAHARSQRDQESFEAREAVAQQRRKEERVNRQQMMGEREKNRQRKLQALGGREWDMEKNEDDFRNTENDRKARRGAHGGIGGSRYATATATAPEKQAEDLIEGFQVKGSAERGRGRGRGGRGRGRGGNESAASHTPKQQQAPPSSSDFPDLPAASKKAEETKAPVPLSFPIAPKPATTGSETPAAAASDTKPKLPHQMSFGLSSPSGEKKSWADQVEGLSSPT